MANDDMLDFLGDLFYQLEEEGGPAGRIKGAICMYCHKRQADPRVMGSQVCQTCASASTSLEYVKHMGVDLGFQQEVDKGSYNR